MGQLEELAAQYGADKIYTVRVDIGTRAGIVVDSFTFGFEILAQENPLTKKAVLEIKQPDGSDLILAQVEME